VEITAAQVKLVSDRMDKLKAFCTITIDNEFVIRDIKVIRGTHGYFVAMPSRKLMDRCPSCGGKNHLRAAHCNDCGAKLRENRVPHDAAGRAKLHADIAHPINSECRERLQTGIVNAYEAEVERSKQPGYVPTPYEDDDYSDHDADAYSSRGGSSKANSPNLPPGQIGTPPPETSGSDDRTSSFGSGIL
jgi:stage V sporulation protein G